MKSNRSRLVLHADDLGMNRAISDGILRGFRHGLLTSTSLLANAPDAARALQQWKELLVEQVAGRLPSAAARSRLSDPPQPFDLGIHLNLTQGRPLTGERYPAELLDHEGRFPGVLALFWRLRRHGHTFQEAIHAELAAQIQFLLNQNLQPTHLNGHQYVELMPEIGRIVRELAKRFGVSSMRVAREPALARSTIGRGQFWKWPPAHVKRFFATRFHAQMDASGIGHPDVFFGTSHAAGIDLRLLQVFLANSSNAHRIEIGLHPGEASPEITTEDRANGWRDPLAHARPMELRMLVSAELSDYLASGGWRLGRLAIFNL